MGEEPTSTFMEESESQGVTNMKGNSNQSAILLWN